jgi:hypothetical protein
MADSFFGLGLGKGKRSWKKNRYCQSWKVLGVRLIGRGNEDGLCEG